MSADVAWESFFASSSLYSKIVLPETINVYLSMPQINNVFQYASKANCVFLINLKYCFNFLSIALQLF
jgi:hypothetical protein